jgi:tetratricopeptide (TPR) repeat protein
MAFTNTTAPNGGPMKRKPLTKEDEFFRAMKLTDARKYAKAIEAYTAVIEKYPDYDRPYNERAMTRLHLDQNEEAVADFRRCLAINPDYPGARDWLARTLFGLKRFAEAAAEKREELRRRPEHPGMGICPQSWADCADYYRAAGDDQAALAVLDDYFRDYADKVTKYACYTTAPMRRYAELMLDRGEPESAVRVMRKAFAHPARCPMDGLVWLRALVAARRYDEARRASAKVDAHVLAGATGEALLAEIAANVESKRKA